ncbi:vacuolar sorting protein VPS33/slp1 [Irineochytrium annulatum]|nr:vacuolar sorting protein VPS33/slp1 [Irineochytrium annulatum]
MDVYLEQCKITEDELIALGIREKATLQAMRSARQDEYGYTWAAIYFVSPTEESVNLILNDLGATGKPLYQHAHVYFTSGLADDLANKMLTPQFKRYLETFEELSIEFFPLESRVFHISEDRAFFDFFHSQSQEEVDKLLRGYAKKFKNVLVCLNEVPEIRYHDQHGTNNTPSARLARFLYEEMEQVKKYDPTFPIPTPYDYHGPAQLLIVDRTIDLLTPFLHSLGYQPLGHDAADVISSVHEGHRRSIVEVSLDGKDVIDATFDESDDIFATIRHMLVFDAAAHITKLYADEISFKDKAQGEQALEELKNKIINLQNIKKRNDQIVALDHLNNFLISELSANRMNEIISFEQELVMGETADEELPENPFDRLKGIMDDEAISDVDKLRLLAIYVLTVDDLAPATLVGLLQGAGMDNSDVPFLLGLRYFGIRQGEKRDLQKPASLFMHQARKAKKGGNSFFSSIFSKRAKSSDGDRAEEKDADDMLPVKEKTEFGHLDRYEPAITYVLHDLVNGRSTLTPLEESVRKRGGLDGKGGSPVRDPGETKRGKGIVMDYKKGVRPSWAKKRIRSDESEDYRHNGSRIILIVLGGLSYTEVRAIYLAAKRYEREIYVGSTHMFTPIEFFQDMHDLGKIENPNHWVFSHMLAPPETATSGPITNNLTVEPVTESSLPTPPPSVGGQLAASSSSSHSSSVNGNAPAPKVDDRPVSLPSPPPKADAPLAGANIAVSAQVAPNPVPAVVPTKAAPITQQPPPPQQATPTAGPSPPQHFTPPPQQQYAPPPQPQYAPPLQQQHAPAPQQQPASPSQQQYARPPQQQQYVPPPQQQQYAAPQLIGNPAPGASPQAQRRISNAQPGGSPTAAPRAKPLDFINNVAGSAGVHLAGVNNLFNRGGQQQAQQQQQQQQAQAEQEKRERELKQMQQLQQLAMLQKMQQGNPQQVYSEVPPATSSGAGSFNLPPPRPLNLPPPQNLAAAEPQAPPRRKKFF